MASVLARRKLLVAPNPLAYPAGAVPGFDPGHVAAGPKAFSAVSLGGGFVDLTTGRIGVPFSTAPASGVNGRMGPTATIVSANNAIKFTSHPQAPSGQGSTVAAIFQITSQQIGGNFNTIFTTDDAGTGGYEFCTLTGGNLGLNVNGGATSDSGLSTVVGVPYFACASINGTSSVDFLLMRLDTGKVTTATVAGVTTLITSSSPTYTVGCVIDLLPLNLVGFVSAVMYSPRAIGLAAMKQFAADPWSFWYPRQTIQYTTPATTTTTTGGARRRQRWNRSPLAYPAGAVPGFDPSHVAARGISSKHGISVVSTPNAFLNLLNGVTATATGLATKVDGILGPGTVSDGISSSLFFTGQSNASDTKLTFAAIVTNTSPATNQAYVVTCGFGVTGGAALGTQSTGIYLYLFLAAQVVASSLVMTAGEPYLVGSSIDQVAGIANFVLLNLRTGKLQTQIVTGTFGAPGPGDQFYSIGSSNGVTQAFGSIAAAMHAPSYLSMAQLQQFASDPWSFWYPNKTINLTSTAASVGASFLPVWAVGYNLPVIGTGIY